MNKFGVWVNYPEDKPNDGERVLIRRNGYGALWEVAVYDTYYECWDDGEGDDFLCALGEVDKFMRITSPE